MIYLKKLFSKSLYSHYQLKSYSTFAMSSTNSTATNSHNTNLTSSVNNHHDFSTIVDDNEILKPDIDDRNYRIIELKNGLTAILIHDPTTDKSAAALDVNVGSYHDPKNLPGLAHFCEHLLFLGTEKYPLENEYNSYLSQNSGYSNAFTSSLHTNYYFEVKNDALYGALDRFSQFFIKPLFSPSGKDREINAVDSENKKNLQSDTWRIYQLSKSTTSELHPHNGFSTGNKMTLGDLPLKENINVRDELIKFHTNNYSSNLMTVSILSNESLDTMANWCIEMFSNIENKSLSRPFFKHSPFDSKNYLNKLYKVKSIREMKNLQITFPIPSTKQYWEYLPMNYLSHLIGHESKGSLLYNFKLKGWANNLSSGASQLSPGFSEFQINIELTNEGVKNYNFILEDIFKYLQMLKIEGPKKWIFDELKIDSSNSFKFKQKAAAASTVSRFAGELHNLNFHEIPLKSPIDDNESESSYNMKSIPPKNFLSLLINRKFDPELINKILGYLSPDNFRVFLVGSDILDDVEDKSLIKNEKWYNTEYTVEDYRYINDLNNFKPDSNLKLPEKNEFITENFALSKSPTTKYPKLIEIDNFSKIWFKSNTALSGPRSAITIKFNLPGSTSTPLNSLYLSLFVEMLDDELNSLSYYASLAGLNYNFNLAREGISLEIIGYSDKQEILLVRLIQTLDNFTNNLNEKNIWNEEREKRFDVLKEKLFRNLKNFGFSSPYQQVGPIISSLVNENSWLIDDEISCFNAVDFISLKNYSINLFKICFVEVLTIGNFEKEDSVKMHKLIKNNLPILNSSITLTESQFTRGRSLYLPQNTFSHYIKPNDDPENINSCIEVFVQIGLISNKRDRLLNELVAQILHEPCFNRLRTIEQLGYVVFSGTRKTRTTFGLRILIQSEFSTFYLLDRINRFLLKMSKSIAKMGDEEFQKHVDALINKKEQKMKNLREERNSHWNRIASGFYDFDRNEEDVALLKTFNLKDIVDFYNTRIVDSNNNGRIAVHLQSQHKHHFDSIKMIKDTFSNFIYDKEEFDDINYESEKVNDVIDSYFKDGNKAVDRDTLAELFTDELLASFIYKNELIDEIMVNISKDWNAFDAKVNGNLIGLVGEWKCSIPLTSAPSAKIETKHCDEDIVIKGKL